MNMALVYGETSVEDEPRVQWCWLCSRFGKNEVYLSGMYLSYGMQPKVGKQICNR